MPTPETAARPSRTAIASVRARLARLRLTGLPVPVGVIIVIAWIALAALLALAAVPGLLDSALVATVDPPTPRAIRVLILAGCAVVAAAALVATVLRDARSQPTRGRTAIRDLAVGATAASVGALLLVSDGVGPAAAAGAAGVATVIVLHVSMPLVARSLLAAALAAVPWVAAIVAQFGEPDFGLFGWLWIVLLPLAAGFGAFGALYGVARAAETRAGRLRPLFRDDLPTWGVALAIAAVLALIVARYSVLRGLFGDLDDQLWTFRVAPSWIHAALVAAAVVTVTLVSHRRPLTRIGRRLATAVFGAAAALAVVLVGPLVITIAVSTLLTGSTVDLTDAALTVAPWVSVGLVALLVVVVAHPVFTASAGRWMTWLGALYVLPGGVAAAAGPAFDDVPAFWTKPPQVAALLALAAAALLVARLMRPQWDLPTRIILRLAIIPLVAVHATALLPAPWESVLGRAVLVLGVVLAVLFFAPAVTADPLHRGERLLRRTAAQLAGVVVFVLALPSVLRGETFEVAGTLWLAIPVAIVLCLTVVPRSATAPAGTPGILIDVEPSEGTDPPRRSTVQQ